MKIDLKDDNKARKLISGLLKELLDRGSELEGSIEQIADTDPQWIAHVGMVETPTGDITFNLQLKGKIVKDTGKPTPKGNGADYWSNN